MKKSTFLFKIPLLLLVFSLLSYHMHADNTIKTNQDSRSELQLLSKSELHLTLLNEVGLINSDFINLEGKDYVKLVVPAYTKSTVYGNPEMPVRRKLIEIPYGAVPSVRIVNYEVAEYKLADYGISEPVMPLQYSVPKCGDAPEFVYNAEVYATDAFIKQELVTVDILGIMRGTRIARVNIAPVFYNPVKNTIRVYENLEFEIDFEGADLAQTQAQKEKYYSPYFSSLLSSLENYSAPADRGDNFTRYPIKYVIVSDPQFEDQLQPLIEWKRRKGFIVVEAYTDVIGTTKEEIKAFLQDLYDNGTPEDPAPSFALFVGDVGEIPAYENGNGETDRLYFEYSGDLFPEVFYGRFSAQNAAQLQPYIDKTLQYEQYTMPDPSFLEEVVMIAGADSGHGHDWGNGQINYGTINYFNEEHDILSHTYLYPESGGSSAQIKQDISNGVAFANYTAHGSPNGWADPSFTISDIPNLQNQDKYGLLIGNCCSTSEFAGSCFAEEIVRAENKGALGYIGGSNSTYWDEDYYFGVGYGTVSEDPPPYEETGLGNYDRAFHDHGETFDEWCTTMDQVVYAGNLAVSESGSGQQTYYWDIYNLMGDPSLMIYYGVPDEMDVEHTAVLMVGATEFEVTAEPYAYIALNEGGENIAVALADQNGDATLEFDALSTPGTVELVITAQDFQPYFEDVLVIVPEGAYCLYMQHTINDDSLGNGNNQADYDEMVFLSVTIKNLGTEPANDVTAVLTTSDSHVEILDGMESYGTVEVDEEVTRENCFLIHLAEDIPDQLEIVFDLEMTDANDSTWTGQFKVMANAPAFMLKDIAVDDAESGNGNGRLDPGEMATLVIETENTGHAPITDVLAVIQAYNPFISVLSNDTVFAGIEAQNSVYARYDVSVDESTPEGVFGEMRYHVTSGGYSAQRSYYAKIGLLVEDWETGNFDKFNWHFDGDADWRINADNPFEGICDAKTGAIGNDQTSELYITYTVMADDTISFYKKVSSEASYDFLEFYIDNTKKGSWSGTSEGWTMEKFAVASGEHTFRWVYAKDYSATGGSDCAWIDYIMLPTMMATTVFSGVDQIVCSETGSLQCDGSATNYETLFWATSGTGTFDDINSMTPVYTLSSGDVENGLIFLSLNLVDVDGYPASDTMALSIVAPLDPPTVPSGPESVNLNEITESEYTTEEVEGALSYIWLLMPEEAGYTSGTSNTAHVFWNMEFDGEAVLSVAVNNECGASDYSEELVIDVTGTVGINDQETDNLLQIIPNPNKGRFQLIIGNNIQPNSSVRLVNLQGQLVYQKQIHASDKVLNFHLDGINSGMYYLILDNGEKRQVKKVLIN